MELNTFNVSEVDQKYREIRKLRKSLDEQSAKLKEVEEGLRKQLYMWLTSNNLPGVRTQSGAVSLSVKDRVEIEDKEVLCRYMFKEMYQAFQEGRPMSDALMFQAQAHKDFAKSLVRKKLGLSSSDKITEEQFNSVAKEMGLRIVFTPDVSVTSK